jgi:hypothetical protein
LAIKYPNPLWMLRWPAGWACNRMDDPGTGVSTSSDKVPIVLPPGGWGFGATCWRKSIPSPVISRRVACPSGWPMRQPVGLGYSIAHQGNDDEWRHGDHRHRHQCGRHRLAIKCPHPPLADCMADRLGMQPVGLRAGEVPIFSNMSCHTLHPPGGGYGATCLGKSIPCRRSAKRLHAQPAGKPASQ